MPSITGLSHVDRHVHAELDRWVARLDELGIAHSVITEQDPWDVLAFRDPDNIKLELFHLEADPASFVPA